MSMKFTICDKCKNVKFCRYDEETKKHQCSDCDKLTDSIS